ncbi:MAG TPA: hypothetical protein PLE74_02380 [Candidatus Cloacimonadota bacterium]|nr:hypothetical protein [Candidatus Cloacimonadota bacterium]
MKIKIVFLVTVIFGFFLYSGCNLDTIVNNNDSNPSSSIYNISMNKAYPLNTPTYDGSGQSIHPDILLLPTNVYSTCGKFILALTPYPGGNNQFENPSLLTSSNGIEFTIPDHVINPLVPTPAHGHNDDPDILFNQMNHQYYYYYLETCKPDSQNFVLLTSSDLGNWNKNVIIHYDLHNDPDFVVSPSVIIDQNDIWHLIYVNNIGSNRIESMNSTNGVQWDENSKIILNLGEPLNFRPWHIDVFQSLNMYYMLACGMADHPNLYIGRSQDLINWDFSPEPILTPQETNLNCNRIYRSSGFVINDVIYIYFSYISPNNQCNIGIFKTKLDSIEF